MQDHHTFDSCPNRHRPPRQTTDHHWARWMMPVAGLMAFLWFLIRVVPKPSRATYPCQRAAMPLASGFVVWLLGLLALRRLLGRAGPLMQEHRVVLMCICLGTAAVIGMSPSPYAPDPPRSVGTAWADR